MNTGWLTSYQTAFLADRSPQKAVVKARRIGFSEVVALECACRAAGVDIVRGTRIQPVNQTVVSASERQAQKLVARVARHLEAFGIAGAPVLTDDPGKSEIKLSNGVAVTAFSSNAASIRGEGGDCTLDEFAAMPRADKLWAAVSAIAKPTLGRPEGYQIRVVFTPLGDDNMAYRIARGDLRDSWSLHEVSIHDAVRSGFPADAEALREEIGDPEIFGQEYELLFLSASARYIPAPLYDSCIPATFAPVHLVSRFAGLDLARRRHLSSLVELGQDTAAALWLLNLESQRDMPWDAQEAWIDHVMQHCNKLAVDGTGIGSQFAERLGARFGDSRVLPITFTLQSKEDLATGLKLAMERKRLHLTNDAELRRDVLSIRRKITSSARTVYETPEQHGSHGDRAWALALAVHAAGGAVAEPLSDGVAATPSQLGRPHPLWGHEQPQRGRLFGDTRRRRTIW
jgi:phage FluMu gp28-like protein